MILFIWPRVPNETKSTINLKYYTETMQTTKPKNVCVNRGRFTFTFPLCDVARRHFVN